MKSTARLVAGLSMAVAAVFMAGCAGLRLPHPNCVKSAHDLGGVYVTVLPPVDFATYHNLLSPGFKLTGDAALEKVAPYTLERQDSSITSAAAGLAAGLPTTTVTNTATHSATGTDVTTSNSSETQKQSGAIPSSSGLPDVTNRMLTPTPPSGDIAMLDPITQYWAATALFQEVQLLNRYISDIDLGGNYHAYVVRLQIAQIPYVRRAPYDCYVDLSFFVQPIGSDGAPSTVSLPHVLPMLVTDSLESSQYNVHAEQVRQLALALQGMVHQVGVNIGTQWYRQIVSDILGRDLNSLLTVARLQDNVLRVRLGAMQQTGGIYAVVPHTQNITIVLLVDKDKVSNGELVVTSKTTWRNTIKHGELLPSSSDMVKDPFYRNRVDLLFRKEGMPKLTGTQYEDLTTAFQNDNYPGFVEILKRQSNGVAAAAAARGKLDKLIEPNKATTEAVQAFTKAAVKVDVDTMASMLTSKTVTDLVNLSRNSPKLVKDTTLANLSPRVTSIVLGNQLGGRDYKLIWAAFGSVFAESSFDRTYIDLPKEPPMPAIGAAKVSPGALTADTALYMFDNKKAISVTVPRLGKVPPARIYGQALFTYGKASPKEQFELLSTASAAASACGGVELTFPSALERGLPKTKVKSLTLYWLNDDGKSTQLGQFKQAQLVPPASEVKPTTQIAITDNSKFIAIGADNSGTVRLYVEKYSADEKPVLLVTGAGLAKATNEEENGKENKTIATPIDKENAVQIGHTGSFTINLDNLVDGAPVSLILTAKASGAKATVGDLTAKLNKK